MGRGPAGWMQTISFGTGPLEQLQSIEAKGQAIRQVEGVDHVDHGERHIRGISSRLTGSRRGSLALLNAGRGIVGGERGNGAQPAQISYMPSEGMASNFKRLSSEIAASAGVPISLIDGSGGSAARESQRVFAVRLTQRAKRLSEDMTAQLGQPVAIDAAKMFQADIAMRARAFKSLRDSGLSIAEARQVTGV